MKTLFSTLAVLMLLIPQYADAAKLKAPGNHCTTGKKAIVGEVKGRCDNPDLPETCTLANVNWCRNQCGHKIDIDKVCKITATLKVTNNLGKPVDYEVVGAVGQDEYTLVKDIKDTLSPNQSVELTPKRDLRDDRIKTVNFNGTYKGDLINRSLVCKGLELGKSYEISFEQRGASFNCIAKPVSG